jgi:hypothetical protein
MRKRIIVSSIAAVALAVGASTAGAATIAQAPAGPGYQNLAPYPNGVGGCFGSTDSGPNYSASSSRPIRLQFGWGAKNAAQMTQFFKYSHGSVTITGTTPATTDSFSDSWAVTAGTPYLTQQGIQWSQLENTQATPPGGGTQVAAVMSNYRGILSISPGTYTLTQTYLFDHPVQDGFASYQKPIVSTCNFTVVP